MANGWGGSRPGAGRKRKSDADMQATDGRRRRRVAASKPATVLSHPSAPPAPPKAELPKVSEEDAPDDLNFEERRVWLKLAPHAMANGTLVDSTMEAFSFLCRNMVLLKAMYDAPLARGTADHRGLIQRVDAQLARFNLTPCGKPMSDAAAAPEQPANPLDRFLKRSRGA